MQLVRKHTHTHTQVVTSSHSAHKLFGIWINCVNLKTNRRSNACACLCNNWREMCSRIKVMDQWVSVFIVIIAEWPTNNDKDWLISWYYWLTDWCSEVTTSSSCLTVRGKKSCVHRPITHLSGEEGEKKSWLSRNILIYISSSRTKSIKDNSLPFSACCKPSKWACMYNIKGLKLPHLKGMCSLLILLVILEIKEVVGECNHPGKV